MRIKVWVRFSRLGSSRGPRYRDLSLAALGHVNVIGIFRNSSVASIINVASTISIQREHWMFPRFPVFPRDNSVTNFLTKLEAKLDNFVRFLSNPLRPTTFSLLPSEGLLPLRPRAKYNDTRESKSFSAWGRTADDISRNDEVTLARVGKKNRRAEVQFRIVDHCRSSPRDLGSAFASVLFATSFVPATWNVPLF